MVLFYIIQPLLEEIKRKSSLTALMQQPGFVMWDTEWLTEKLTLILNMHSLDSEAVSSNTIAVNSCKLNKHYLEA